jgi:hypothetical protein
MPRATCRCARSICSTTSSWWTWPTQKRPCRSCGLSVSSGKLLGLTYVPEQQVGAGISTTPTACSNPAPWSPRAARTCCTWWCGARSVACSGATSSAWPAALRQPADAGSSSTAARPTGRTPRPISGLDLAGGQDRQHPGRRRRAPAARGHQWPDHAGQPGQRRAGRPAHHRRREDAAAGGPDRHRLWAGPRQEREQGVDARGEFQRHLRRPDRPTNWCSSSSARPSPTARRRRCAPTRSRSTCGPTGATTLPSWCGNPIRCLSPSLP